MEITRADDADPTLKAVIVAAVGDAVKEFGRFGLTPEAAANHAWTWVADHAQWVQDIMDQHPDDWTRVVTRLLRAENRVLGDAQRCASLGIAPWENFYYTTAGVEEALRAVFHPTGWMDGPPRPDDLGIARYRPTQPHADWMISMADVNSAMKHLSPQDRLTLKALYGCDVPIGRLAEALALTANGMTGRRDSILRKIVRHLGGTRPERQCISTCDHPKRTLLSPV